MHRSFAAFAAAFALALPSAALAVPKAGQTAPPFALPSVDGKTVSLASLHGKPVYLNFFASWCGPCNQEAPFIGKLSGKYKARGLTVVGVDELESAQKAGGFVARYHLPFTAVVDGDGRIGRDYGAIGLPLHVFIDRSGVVKTYRLGEMDAAEVEAAIKGIL